VQRAAEWDAAYADTPPPWDIGRPQPVLARLADSGLLGGRVLDSGCGTGEHTLLAAEHGAAAVGVDLSPRAISQAGQKAAARGLTARFEVGDALDLPQLGTTFDTIIDSGLFHVFDDQDRARYVTSLASVLEPGGTCYLTCFSDRQPGTAGPRRIRQEELVQAVRAGWEMVAIAAETFAVNRGFDAPLVQAWLATIRRL
jgi:cyclopropane fatty-acyl-phospholipid synthase-like methyltransferase